MNYVVPSCTLRNLKLVGVETNSFYNLVRSKPFVCQGLIIPSLHLEVSSINQDPVVNVKVSCIFNMKDASLVVHLFEDVVNVVVYCSYSIKLFFCGRRAEFVVIVKVYGAWIKTIETSV